MAPPVSIPASRSLVAFGLAAAVALGAGCATTSTTAPSTATAAKAPTGADAEVVVLRERVARLEKRLAEVDGKLSLLLARAETTSSQPTFLQTPPVRVARAPAPVVERAPGAAWDLATVGAGEGLTSIDIERTPPAGDDVVHDVPDVPDAPRGRSDDDGSDDDGGTVVLKMHGDAAPEITRSGGGGGASDDDDPLSALRSPKDLYAWGQARLKEGRHLEAVAAFEDVIGRFPRDGLADNSLYWIGVCHQARGEHRLAVAEWQKLPARFPKSDKIPDALFGMAESHEALGEPAVAEVLYDEILASYPKAEKFKDAKKAVARLRP